MEHYGYNPADYSTHHETLLFRGVSYVKVTNLFCGKETHAHFECNCQNFENEDKVRHFINTTFFDVPDPFVAI